MEEIIQSISSRLGLDETATRDAVKVIIGFARSQMSASDFDELLAQVPGAAKLAAEAAPQAASGGAGLLGGIGALLGGPAAAVLGQLQAAGVPSSKMVPLVQAFVDKAREMGAGHAIEAFLDKAPVLKSFVK